MDSELSSLLQQQPEKADPGRPSAALLLFPAALLSFLGRYLARQGVNFQVSESFADDLGALIINSRPPAADPLGGNREKPPLPAFVLNYLANLARCNLFLPAGRNPGSRDNKELAQGILVEYGWRLAETSPKPTGERKDDFLALVFAAGSRPALVLEPAPRFRPLPIKSQPQPLVAEPRREVAGKTPGRLEIRLELTGNPKPAPVRALYLEGKEIDWLARLAGRLPGRLLRRLAWAGDRDRGVLLLPEKESLFLFPFGTPLGREKENLYLPVDRRLTPRLTPEQLDEILDLAKEWLTFFTGAGRIEIAKSAFRPLDRHLLPIRQPTVTIRPADPTAAFALDPTLITATGQSSPETPAATAAETEATTAETARDPVTPVAKESAITVTHSGADPRPAAENENQLLHRKGLELRRAGDLLGAAVCFGLAGEDQAAADCYRLAALELENGDPPLPAPAGKRE